MTAADITQVVQLIDSHDEDDAAEARLDYEKQGIDNQFVLEINNEVIGVTGYRAVAHSNNTYWLSWTYIHDDYCNQGHGRTMLQQLMDILKQQSARKIFVKVSDYEDPEDGKIYAAALHLYQSLGFQLEVTLPDYYDEQEAMMILGYSLTASADIDIPPTRAAVKFNAVFEIAETDGAYSFGWEVNKKKHFDEQDLKIGIEAVEQRNGRVIYLSFPSDLASVTQPLIDFGFIPFGKLADYYDDGVDELHFGYHLLRNKTDEK